MKKIAFAAALAFMLVACKPTNYAGSYGQINQTQVVLTAANFKVLGSFHGTATAKKYKMTVKDQQGVISQAKGNMLANAKAAGIELTGSRALVNVSVDVVDNSNKLTATVTADIIEFTK